MIFMFLRSYDYDKMKVAEVWASGPLMKAISDFMFLVNLFTFNIEDDITCFKAVYYS